MPRITKITPIKDSGLDADRAGAIFEQVSRFAGYGFNKSHAAAYAAISFRTAWLKTHHPEAFFAAAMNLNLDEVDDIATFVHELKKRNIAIWAPSINASRALFEPLRLKKRFKGRDFGICYAFAAIRGVGIAAAHAIEAERTRAGAFRSIEDFSQRMGTIVNRTAMVALAKAGAFDTLGVSRPLALAQAKGNGRLANIGQFNMFDIIDAAPVVDEGALSADEIYDNEFDVLGHYMTAHPLEDLRDNLFEENLSFSGRVLDDPRMRAKVAHMPGIITKSDVSRTSSGDIMAVLMLTDPDGVYEALAFGDTWTKIRHLAKKKTRVILDVSISLRDDEKRLIIRDANPLSAPMSQAA